MSGRYFGFKRIDRLATLREDRRFRKPPDDYCRFPFGDHRGYLSLGGWDRLIEIRRRRARQ